MTDRSADWRRTVYQPAEDSTLLAEAAIDHIEPTWTVVETGVGSGFVADRLREAHPSLTLVGIDINPHACRATASRSIPVVRGSLLDPIASGTVDAALFNPPYLPTHEAMPDDWLERAVAGGPTGAEVVLAWMSDLARVLTTGGIGVCVISSHTGIDRICAVATDLGFDVEVIAETRVSFERLVALVLRQS